MMMMMRKIGIAAAFLMGLNSQVFAADIGEFSEYDFVTPPQEKKWDASLMLYGWLMSMDYDADVADQLDIEYEIDFGEFLENLKMFAAGFGEVRYGRFGIAADVLFADLSDNLTVFDEDVFGEEVSLKLGGDLLIATLMGEYRIWEQEKSSIDLMAGARLWYMKNDVEGELGGLDIVLDGLEFDWVDPMIGVKTRIQCDCRFTLPAGQWSAASA